MANFLNSRDWWVDCSGVERVGSQQITYNYNNIYIIIEVDITNGCLVWIAGCSECSTEEKLTFELKESC